MQANLTFVGIPNKILHLHITKTTQVLLRFLCFSLYNLYV